MIFKYLMIISTLFLNGTLLEAAPRLKETSDDEIKAAELVQKIIFKHEAVQEKTKWLKDLKETIDGNEDAAKRQKELLGHLKNNYKSVREELTKESGVNDIVVLLKKELFPGFEKKFEKIVTDKDSKTMVAVEAYYKSAKEYMGFLQAQLKKSGVETIWSEDQKKPGEEQDLFFRKDITIFSEKHGVISWGIRFSNEGLMSFIISYVPLEENGVVNVNLGDLSGEKMKLKTKKSLASAAKVIPLESLTFTYIFDFEANNLNFTISKSEKGRKTFSPVELLNYLSFGESFESLTDELYASFENFESAEDKKIESNYLERLNAGKLSLEVQNEVAQNMKDIIKKILTIPTASSDSLWKVEK